MGYGEFRTGANQIDLEGREIAKIVALRRIAAALEALLAHLVKS